MFINTSDHDVLLKNLGILLTIDEKPETRTKKQKKVINIKLPPEGIILEKKGVYSVKFSNHFKISS